MLVRLYAVRRTRMVYVSYTRYQVYGTSTKLSLKKSAKTETAITGSSYRKRGIHRTGWSILCFYFNSSISHADLCGRDHGGPPATTRCRDNHCYCEHPKIWGFFCAVCVIDRNGSVSVECRTSSSQSQSQSQQSQSNHELTGGT